MYAKGQNQVAHVVDAGVYLDIFSEGTGKSSAEISYTYKTKLYLIQCYPRVYNV